MNLAYNYQLIPDLRKVKDMERFIAGSYWENDVWNLNDPFWDDYSIGKKSFTSRRITFFEYPSSLSFGNEVLSGNKAFKENSQPIIALVRLSVYAQKIRVFSSRSLSPN